MSSAPQGAVPVQTPPEEENYLTHSRGILSWLLTLDHKRIGIMYLIGILTAFTIGGVFALLIRTALWTPGPGPITTDPTVYNMWFTLHGAIMVFLVIIPGVPAALGNFVLPIMLGAKDVAFPRLNLFSFYLWTTGAIWLLVALALGGLDTGWTFYTPYSTTYSIFEGVVPALTGVFILGFSSILTGLNFIVTTHKLRPPGMTWFRMPLFIWAIYSTAVIQVLATPVLAITLLLLIVEHFWKLGIFTPSMGGDPVLYQHFFWFYSHPAVYIMILPAMGIMSELITIHSRRHIFGYRFIAYSSVAIAIFGFLVWGHHMFTTMSPMLNAIFSLLTFSVSIPSAIKVFNWLATLYKGSIRLCTPMLYALAFIFIFAIGGLTGLFLGTLSVDIQLHDTYFVVAHFHYVMMGSAMIAFFGGLHHWWPKIFGRMYSERFGKLSFWLIFIGFNVAFFPQFIMGSLGMPRRYFVYLPEYVNYHRVSTVGAFMMLVGFVVMAVYLIHSLVAGRKAPANPWGGNSLEWHCTSPPIHENFKEAPTVGDCYDFTGWRYDASVGGFVPKTQPAEVVPTRSH